MSADLIGTGLAAVVISVLMTGSRPWWISIAVLVSAFVKASIIFFIERPAMCETTQMTPSPPTASNGNVQLSSPLHTLNCAGLPAHTRPI